ncbi:MAG: hypothetical protein ACR2NP_22355, partial [Pirellulaceae bacterium]
GDNNTDIAYSAELGAYARYKITRKTRLRFGYEIMGLANVREVEETYSTVVTQLSGFNYNRGGALFHGATIGFEIYR